MGTPQQEPPRKPTIFEVLSTLIVPGLSLVAAIVALQRDQRIIAWVLLGVLLLSFAVGFYPLVKTPFQEYLSEMRDEKLARKAFPEFRKFVRDFEQFVSPRAGETLHVIVQSEVCGSNTTNYDRFGLPPVRLFHDWWRHLSPRVGGKRVSLPDFERFVLEFNDLISDFSSDCVRRIFGQFPDDLRPSLNDRAKGSLEAFRERFVRFLDAYRDYLKGLEESLRKPRIQARYFERPKPL